MPGGSIRNDQASHLAYCNLYGRHVGRTDSKSRAVLIGMDRVAAEVHRLAFVLGGFSVDLARDGEEGVHRVLCQELPDVVVVDLGLPRVIRSMPRRDALEFLSVLRSMGVTNKVPVLALVDDSESAADALERGAVAWLSKETSSPSMVLGMADRLLTHRTRE